MEQKIKLQTGLVDRLRYAAELCRGKSVLDIGGHKYVDVEHTRLHQFAMNITHKTNLPPFVAEYHRIQEGAKDYRVVDIQQTPATDYVLDLNQPSSVPSLRKIIEEYQPEVILCMETLEHVNCHFEVMNEISRAINQFSAVTYITLPNNGNWVLNALGWNNDHILGFFRQMAWQFVVRSDLGCHEVVMQRCMQKYVWYWRPVYWLSGGQPFSWGFVIRRRI